MTKYYTIREASELANVSNGTLRYAILSGSLPITEIGSKKFFSDEQMEAVHEYSRSVKRKRLISFTAWGETKTLREWSRDPRCKVVKSALANRFRREWIPEDMLTVPVGEGLRYSRDLKAGRIDCDHPERKTSIDAPPASLRKTQHPYQCRD